MGKTKKLFPILFVIILVMGGTRYYLSLPEKPTTDTGQEVTGNGQTPEREKTEGELRVEELATKYRAITGWEEKDLTYTLQAQELLMNGKPALFKGYIDDVFDKAGKRYIRFAPTFFNKTSYILELECRRAKLAKALSDGAGGTTSTPPEVPSEDVFVGIFDEYAVVASIHEISKPILALEGSLVSEDQVEINIEPSNTFIMKGTCLEIISIGGKS